MHGSIPIYFKALFIASIFALLAEVVLTLIPVLKKYYIPRAFLGGLVALIAGPQVLGGALDLNLLSTEVQESWNQLSLFFVNVIFACIFLGRKLPDFKTSLHLAIPQASLGQTLAWGQYLVGGLVTLLVLIPIFELDESVASFIEISFQGGVGVAVGMEETFKSIGMKDAKAITVALAPLAMLTGILSGIFLINLNSKPRPQGQDPREKPQEINKKPNVNRFQNALLLQVALIGLAILGGWLLLQSLDWLEQKLFLEYLYSDPLVKYIPLFPLALLGGAALQWLMDKASPLPLAHRLTIKRIQLFALDAVIIMAIGTVNLGVVEQNIVLVLILLATGLVWNAACFLLLYKLLIPKFPFERGIADFGQSMGTTSIGLMLQSIADKSNTSGGKEAFAIKQILFEPFVGGGIITALSPILIKKMGLVYFTSMAFVLTLGFFLVGYFYAKKRKRRDLTQR